MTITVRLIFAMIFWISVTNLANAGLLEYVDSNYVQEVRVLQNYSVAEYGVIRPFNLDFSPSGTKLLFSFSNSDGDSLRLFDLTNGSVQEILHRPNPLVTQNYTQGEFGRTLFFNEDLVLVSYLPKRPGDDSLWTLNLKSGEFKQLLNRSLTPTARTSGGILAYSTEGEVWLVSPPGNARLLFDNYSGVGLVPSASGDKLLFDYYFPIDSATGERNFTIWISDMDGKNRRPFIVPQGASTRYSIIDGRWTKDGRIYFMTVPNSSSIFDYRNLTVKPNESAEPVQVTHFPLDVVSLTVSPNGDRAALVADTLAPSGHLVRSQLLLLELKPSGAKPTPPQPGFELTIAFGALLGALVIYSRRRPQ